MSEKRTNGPAPQPGPTDDLIIRWKLGRLLLFNSLGAALGAAMIVWSPMMRAPATPGTRAAVLNLLPPEGRVILIVVAGLIVIAGCLFNLVGYFRSTPRCVMSPVGCVAFTLLGPREIHWSELTQIQEVHLRGVAGFRLKAPRGQGGSVFVVATNSDATLDQIRDYIRKYRPDLFEPPPPSTAVTSS